MVAREVKTPFGVIYPSRMQTARGDAREPRFNGRPHIHTRPGRNHGRCATCGADMDNTTESPL